MTDHCIASVKAPREPIVFHMYLKHEMNMNELCEWSILAFLWNSKFTSPNFDTFLGIQSSHLVKSDYNFYLTILTFFLPLQVHVS